MSKEFFVTGPKFEEIQDELLTDIENIAAIFIGEDTALYNSIEDEEDKKSFKRMTWTDAYKLALQLQANTIKVYKIDYLTKTVL
jgi:hypothetical protein